LALTAGHVVAKKQEASGFQLLLLQSFFRVRLHCLFAVPPLLQQLPVQILPLLHLAVGSSVKLPSQEMALVLSVQVAFFQQQEPMTVRPDWDCLIAKQQVQAGQ
jgi:hypothetical protein